MSSPQEEAIELERIDDSRPLTGQRDLKRIPSASNYADMEERTVDNSTKSKLQPYLIYFFIVPIIILFFFLLLVIIFVFLYRENFQEQTPFNPVVNTTCKAPPVFGNPFNNNLKRFPVAASPLLLKSVRVFNGETFLTENMDIFMRDGFIEKLKVSSQVSASEEAGYKVLQQYRNAIVTPGLIDMHSHLGVYSLPGDLNANSDGNELTDPTLPMVRAVDAINPEDPAIEQMLAEGGVTSALVLPGSGNVIGGEAAYVKLRKSKLVSDMLMKDVPRALKMACGENPKRVYGTGKGEMPASRMGVAWKIREILEEARQLKLRQDDWDCANQTTQETTRRPHSLRLEPLVELLRQQNINLNVHCYMVHDLEMMMRISDEFGFKINAFHHALDAYKIAEEIAKRQITVATFSDLYGYKWEAYDASTKAPHILYKAGVKVSIKSDHPVTHAKDLLWNAQKAYHYGLDATAALQSVTTIPAQSIGLSHRIGSIKVGWEADLVVWDRHPLRLGATPSLVIMDGNERFHNENINTDATLMTAPTFSTSALKVTSLKPNTVTKLNKYKIKANQIYTMNEQQTMLQNAVIVVENGQIICLGDCQSYQNDPSFIDISLNNNDGIIVPGFIDATSDLGLTEIQSEITTNDYSSSYTASPAYQFVSTSEGIRMQGRSMYNAFRGGVTSALVNFRGGSVVNGLSSIIYTHDSCVTVRDALVDGNAAVQWIIGNRAKSSVKTVSGQINMLRQSLRKVSGKSISPTDDVETVTFKKILQKELTVFVRVYQADDIGHVLDLQEEFGFKMVLVGAAEAHVVAKRIASNADVLGVILTPLQEDYVATMMWDTLRSDSQYGLSTLVKSGINVGIGAGELYTLRNIRWIAGLASERKDFETSLTFVEALATITSNVAKMMNKYDQLGSVRVNQRANFILFDKLPLTFEGKPRVIATGMEVIVEPEQY